MALRHAMSVVTARDGAIPEISAPRLRDGRPSHRLRRRGVGGRRKPQGGARRQCCRDGGRQGATLRLTNVPARHDRRCHIHRLPRKIPADLLAKPDHLRGDRAGARPMCIGVAFLRALRRAVHVHAGYAGRVRTHVGMQQRRHALQQGEQRNQNRVADFHGPIIGRRPCPAIDMAQTSGADDRGRTPARLARLTRRAHRWP